MRRLKKIGMLQLTICLNLSCANIELPIKSDERRCIISVKFNKCRCHTYRVSPEFVGRVDEPTDHALEYCDNLVGFDPEGWVRFVLWFEETFQAVRDANSQSQIPRPYIETPNDIKELIINY